MRPVPAVIVLFVLSSTVVGLGAADRDLLTRAWRADSQFLFADAAELAGQLPGEAGPAADYLRAVTLLNLPPTTAAKIQTARNLLQQAARDQGEIGLRSRYFLARLDQLHAQPGDPVGARDQYRALSDAYPAHPIGQAALVRWMLLIAFDPAAPDSAPERLARLAAKGRALTDPDAQRQFHLLLSEAYLRLAAGYEPALTHVEAALALGIPSATMRADLVFRSAQLGERIGASRRAAEHYRQFLAEFPRDKRAHYAELRRRALEDES